MSQCDHILAGKHYDNLWHVSYSVAEMWNPNPHELPKKCPRNPHLRTHLLDPLHRRINGRQQLLLISFQAPFQALGTRQDLAEVAAEAVALPRHRQQQGIDGRFETEIDLGWTWDLRILPGIFAGGIMGPDGIFGGKICWSRSGGSGTCWGWDWLFLAGWNLILAMFVHHFSRRKGKQVWKHVVTRSNSEKNKTKSWRSKFGTLWPCAKETCSYGWDPEFFPKHWTPLLT